VPPYFRLVVPSACWNASKISFCLSGGMPMPVSGGELEGVRQQVEHHLLETLFVGVDRLRQVGREVHLERQVLLRR